ncbi:hypothetical protein [Actinocorallia populi]|uniref:hypothetical protein n=1 Tax=Actinocorallia populi TaxID=2079200 RepID=UPI000D091FB5|nr:hypothetical protein [Actinocorallia populi]
MSAKRINRRTAERMLRGRSVGHPVAHLLDSAAAPGRADELDGEAEAVAYFQEAFVGAPVPSALPEEKPSPRPTSTRRLTARVAGAVLAIGAIGAAGGVAIAAGGVPGQEKAEPKKPPPRTSAPAHTRKYAPPPPSPAPAARPSIADLCRKYITEGRKDEHLTPLIKAAGGKQKAIALCVALMGGDRPAGGWPTDWPKEWPADWPKNQKWPTAWPTELPKEWVRPPDGRKAEDTSGRRAEGTAERQSLWPEGWPENWPELGF